MQRTLLTGLIIPAPPSRAVGVSADPLHTPTRARARTLHHPELQWASFAVIAADKTINKKDRERLFQVIRAGPTKLLKLKIS